VDGVDDLPGVGKPDPLAHAVPDKRPIHNERMVG
jgi:hypothetical protein